MAQWSGTLFKGKSLTASLESGLSAEALNMPRGYMFSAIYVASLVGGLSGALAIRVFGNVNGVTIPIAGRTGLVTPGSFQLWNLCNGTSQNDVYPRPITVALESPVGAVAISYNVTVSAAMTSVGS